MAEKRPGSLRSHFRTRNRALAREIASLERAADLPSTILILGESGTGKDRLARAIHDVSVRAASPFVRVDAANLSDELFESELFGHERGAFTGAIAAKKGLLEVAEDGTVYLDEVSSLSPAAQAKFLRVLQEKNFRRLAGVDDAPVSRAPDRLLAARPREPRRAGGFPRRLLLPDRRRLDPAAARSPIVRRTSFRSPAGSPRRGGPGLRTAGAAIHEGGREHARCDHPWPGNVRELLHVVEKAVLTAEARRDRPRGPCRRAPSGRPSRCSRPPSRGAGHSGS